MNKTIKVVCITLLTLALFGCSNNIEFPEESDFELTSNISKQAINVGEELTVEVVFKNLSNDSYNLNSGATFTKSGLIHVKMYKLNEEELVLVGAGRHVEIAAGQEVTEERVFQMDEVGKFKITVFSNFDITNPKTKEQRKYKLSLEPVIIEVK